MARDARGPIRWLVACVVLVLLAALLVSPGPPAERDAHGDALPEGAVGRLGGLRFRYEGSIDTIAFSPDGTTIASASSGRFELWEAATGKWIRRLEGFAELGSPLVFSPDGALLVGDIGLGGARVWNARTGASVCVLGVTRVEGLAFSPDSKSLAVASMSGVRLWDVASTSELAIFGEPYGVPVPFGQDDVTRVAFSADGRLLAHGSSEGAVWVHDLASGELLQHFEESPGRLHALTFAPDSQQVLIHAGKLVLAWSVTSGKELLRIEHGGRHTVFAPDASFLVSTSRRSVGRLTFATGAVDAFKTTHRSRRVAALALSADGKTLATGAYDTTLRLWDLDTQKELLPPDGHAGSVNSLAYSPRGLLASGGSDGTVRLWDPKTQTELAVLSWGRSSLDVVSSVAFSNDGSRLVSGSWSGVVRLWDVEARKELHALRGHGSKVNAVVFFPDGAAVASAGGAEVRVWDPATGACVAVLKTEVDASHNVQSLACSPDGKTLAAGDKDGRIVLWDPATGAIRRTIKAPNWVNALAFSPDGKTLVSSGSGNVDPNLHLWDVETGARRETFDGHTNSVESLAFSPDGARIASGGRDMNLFVWRTGFPVGTIEHSLQAVADHGNPLSLFDVVDMDLAQLLSALAATKGSEDRGIHAVAFSPDGGTLAAGSERGTILLWRLGD